MLTKMVDMTEDAVALRIRLEKKARNRAKYNARQNRDVWVVCGRTDPFGGIIDEMIVSVIVEPPTKSSKGGKRHRNLITKTKSRFHCINDVRGGYGWQDLAAQDVMTGNKPNHGDRVVNFSYMPRVPLWGHTHGH